MPWYQFEDDEDSVPLGGKIQAGMDGKSYANIDAKLSQGDYVVIGSSRYRIVSITHWVNENVSRVQLAHISEDEGAASL